MDNEQVYELIRNYDECNGGLILVNGEELQNADEYYVDKDEVIHMIDINFSQEDSIIYYTGEHLEIYNKNDGYYFDNGYDIDESNVYYVFCPLQANDEHKQQFKDLIKYIQIKDTLKDYKDLLESNGELNHMADSGYKYEDMYHYGYLEWLNALCVKYNIEFDTNKIEWEWCNYIHSKQSELEFKLEEKLGLR